MKNETVWKLCLLFTLTLTVVLGGGCGDDDDDDDDDNDDSADDDDSSDDDDDDSNDDDDDDDAIGSECDENNTDWTVGLLYCNNNATEGYTLFAPNASTTTYLIDIHGRQVNSWPSDHRPGQAVYLHEDGSLLRTVNTGINSVFDAGGKGGGVEIRDWDGDLTWDFEYCNTDHCSHHDMEMLPNGNVLLVVWQYKSSSEAIAAGRNPSLLLQGSVWPDSIIEFEPDGLNGGIIVWEWHIWDHLIQDYDAGKDNYGVIGDHPELVDLNYAGQGGADWTHVNAVDYNAEFDQIVISVHNLSEFWVIDHSTTTGEAAGHSGGDFGMGGDILYRWGNPQTYDAGNSGDQMLFVQHDAQWIPEGLPGEGNFLVYNNGTGRSDGNYSTVDELTPPVDALGVYDYTAGQAYDPDQLAWTFVADTPSDFYSPNISGAQRQSTGNTLICEGSVGEIFEVTEDGEIVWFYINPVASTIPVNQGDSIPNQGPNNKANNVFRAYRYPPDYPAFDGRDMTPGDYIEGPEN
jgi:Arylsulfotransferase (ASST)